MRPKRIPLKQLQMVYELACEMSHCNAYFEIDDDGQPAGRRTDILKALNSVRVSFGLDGEVES